MLKYYLYILIAIVICSCSTSPFVEEPDIETVVPGLYVATNKPLAAVKTETGDNDESAGEDEETEAETTDEMIIDSFDENSILYFSQMGSTATPNFPEGLNDGNYDENAQPYCYRYKYNPADATANWDRGYNFTCLDGAKSFNWNEVPGLGSVGNAFSFFAMYFPGDNKIKWAVQTDQSEKENFIKSDIMGAYHATSTLYTRLRFNLFHLMVYLKVTIYVPTYKADINNDNYNYSGFNEDAVIGAYVLNAKTGFTIDWRAVRSSDRMAPLTQSNNPSSNIKMFSHPATGTIKTIDVRDYYNGGTIPQDDVRAYTFSVIFPSQPFGDNFLCFALKGEDNTPRYFYFSGSQIVGDSGNYSLSQGTLQELTLYLPRNSNETILVGANILPWKDSVTDMTVTKDPPKKD